MGKCSECEVSKTEIPGSLVSEPKRRDSRFKSRLGIGLGTESQTFQVSESEPEPKLRHSMSLNQNRNRNLMSVEFSLQLQALFDLKQPFLPKKAPFLSENIWNQNRNAKTLGSRLGIVSESESSSKPVQSRNRNRNRVQSLCSLGTGLGIVF